MESVQSQRISGDPNAIHAPYLIQRSWERCARQSGDLHTDPIMLSGGDLKERLVRHTALLQAARPEIEILAGMVASTDGIVLLTDDNGVILQSLGDTGFLQRAEQVALRPGVSWAEDHRGTNAIGTALIEGTSVRVHGGEHFLQRNRILSCHGAPVRSPQGDILGVLDISCDAGKLHAYALKLAAMFARQVTNRMLDQAGRGYDTLVFHRQASSLDSIERAQLLLNDGHIVGANDAAIAMLGATWQHLLNQPLDAWMHADWRQAGNLPVSIDTSTGAAVVVRLHRKSAPSIAAPARPDASEASGKRADALHTPPATHAPDAQAPAMLPEPAPELRAEFERTLKAFDGGLAVLIQGPTGSGKEVYARRLHARCARSGKPFVAINCGALPESLIEAELFGYAPGAYTGANRHGSLGRLREAHGGVLFLDEIGDMPLPLQTRLLRVLQEREIRPLGSDKAVAVDFLLISATNQDLDSLLRQGQFRSDLFYRLQDQRVQLQPLAMRQDLPGFLCTEFNRLGALEKSLTLSDDACRSLAAYAWPGNYRELQSVLRALVIHSAAGSLLQVSDLPEHLQAPHASGATGETPAMRGSHTSLRDIDEQHIRRTLHRSNGNISETARLLGIHRSTLHRRLKRLS